MRVPPALTVSLLLAAFAAGGIGLARGALPGSDHEDREIRIRDDDNAARDALRDQRDAERRERDLAERDRRDAEDQAEREAKAAEDDAERTARDAADAAEEAAKEAEDAAEEAAKEAEDAAKDAEDAAEDAEDDSDDDDSDDGDDEATAAAGDRDPVQVEIGQDGRERRKGEFLVRGDRRLAETLTAAGFVPLSVRHLRSLEQSVVRVRVREGSSVDADIAAVRALQGARGAEPNYVYRLSGDRAVSAPLATGAAAPASVAAGNAAPEIRVGVIDTGADASAPGLTGRIASSRSFGGRYTPRPHGTRVAQILVRLGARVDVADVFQTDAQGAPVATAESIARGIDWMAAHGVPVINVSITGAHSPLLSDVVGRAIARGSVIVAAAGNDGPAAPPTYPAAFPDVIGVTAVDAGGRVYRRANRGEYVDFAAFGVRVPVDAGAGRTDYVTGTSYAAPLVAAIVARRYRAARPGDAGTEVGALRGRAVDLGDRGRDPVYGWGLLPPPAR